MGYHTSFAFTAPPDIVYAVMTELGLLRGWLADDLAMTRDTDDTFVVGAAAARYRIALCAENMRLRWDATTDGGAWSGHAVVCALPVGGSVLQLKLAMPAAMRPLISNVDRVVSQVLRRIDEESVRRFRQPAQSKRTVSTRVATSISGNDTALTPSAMSTAAPTPAK
jgi:uncharacterized protein YndB with AHSA1/START domain